MSTEEGALEAKIKTHFIWEVQAHGSGETGKLLSGGVHVAYRTASQGGRQEEIIPSSTLREQESRGGLSADSPAPFISSFPLVIVCPVETAPRDTQSSRWAAPLVVSQEGRPHAAHWGASFTLGSGRNSGHVTGASVAEVEPGGPEWQSWAWCRLCEPSGWKLRGNQRCRDWCPMQRGGGEQKQDETLS